MMIWGDASDGYGSTLDGSLDSTMCTSFDLTWLSVRELGAVHAAVDVHEFDGMLSLSVLCLASVWASDGHVASGSMLAAGLESEPHSVKEIDDGRWWATNKAGCAHMIGLMADLDGSPSYTSCTRDISDTGVPVGNYEPLLL